MENEGTMLLTTIPGIGYFSALLIYAERYKAIPELKEALQLCWLSSFSKAVWKQSDYGKDNEGRKQIA